MERPHKMGAFAMKRLREKRLNLCGRRHSLFAPKIGAAAADAAAAPDARSSYGPSSLSGTAPDVSACAWRLPVAVWRGCDQAILEGKCGLQSRRRCAKWPIGFDGVNGPATGRARYGRRRRLLANGGRRAVPHVVGVARRGSQRRQNEEWAESRKRRFRRGQCRISWRERPPLERAPTWRGAISRPRRQVAVAELKHSGRTPRHAPASSG